jgi:hypothetical protein
VFLLSITAAFSFALYFFYQVLTGALTWGVMSKQQTPSALLLAMIGVVLQEGLLSPRRMALWQWLQTRQPDDSLDDSMDDIIPPFRPCLGTPLYGSHVAAFLQQLLHWLQVVLPSAQGQLLTSQLLSYCNDHVGSDSDCNSSSSSSRSSSSPGSRGRQRWQWQLQRASSLAVAELLEQLLRGLPAGEAAEQLCGDTAAGGVEESGNSPILQQHQGRLLWQMLDVVLQGLVVGHVLEQHQ